MEQPSESTSVTEMLSAVPESPEDFDSYVAEQSDEPSSEPGSTASGAESEPEGAPGAAEAESATGQSAEPGSEGSAGSATPKALSQHFTISDAEEGLDIGALTLKDLMDSPRISFKRSGEQVTATLEDLVRDAQQLGKAQSQAERMLEQRNTTAAELNELKPELESLRAMEHSWREALEDEAVYKEAREAYMRAIGKGGSAGSSAPSGAPAEKPAGSPPAEPSSDDAYKAGESFFAENLWPHMQSVAEAYGADAQELSQTVLERIGEEPPQFLTLERVQEIVNDELAAELRRAGYEAAKQVDPWAPPQAAASGSRRGRGLTPKAERSGSKQSELEQLRARIAQLEAGGSTSDDDEPPPSGNEPSGIGAGRKSGASAEDRALYRSEAIDVSEAESAEDIFKALRT